MWWENKGAGSYFFWRLPWLTAGVSDRSQAGPSCGGCACAISSSPLAHRGVKPGEAGAKGQQIDLINKPPLHTCLSESPTVLAHWYRGIFFRFLHQKHDPETTSGYFDIQDRGTDGKLGNSGGFEQDHVSGSHM